MTEEIKAIIIGGFVSLVASIIAAIVTSKITLRQDTKKRIHEKQEEVYIECFELLQSVKDDPYLVFNNELFYSPLCSLRTKLNLFASKKVISILEPFYVEVKSTVTEFWNLFEGEEYEKLKISRKEYEGLTEIDFQNEEESYIENHLLDTDSVETTMANIVDAMRKDIGTNEFFS